MKKLFKNPQIISAYIAMLVPVVIGLLLWNQLPDEIAVHWDMYSQPDSWMAKPLVVLGIPLFLMLLQTFALFGSRKNFDTAYTGGLRILMIWLVPAICIIACGMVYVVALGPEFDMARICLVLVSILIIVLGNLMPKARRNSTFGLRTSWSMKSDKNWILCQRIGGRWLAAGGICSLCLSFAGYYIPALIFLFGGMAAAILASYLACRKTAA